MKAHQVLSETAGENTPVKLLTTEEVATWLGIKRCTLEKARSTRLGDFPPYIRIGRVIRYRPVDVETWISQHIFNIDGTSPLSSAAQNATKE